MNKSQALLLANGFLDAQAEGQEDKSILQPRETFSELFLIAGELVESAQENLNENNSNASGGLSKSIVLGEPRKHGSTIEIDIYMAEHGQYINKGVKGTRSGQGEYQFKTENPSSKMLANLLRNKIRAKKSSTLVNKAKSVSKNELKNKAISEINSVWGAAVNIKRYGIKPTGFMDKAISVAEKKIDDRLGRALEIDIINSI